MIKKPGESKSGKAVGKASAPGQLKPPGERAIGKAKGHDKGKSK
jgi:hypothetical protein